MELNEAQKETTDNYVLDVKKTLISNIFQFIGAVVGLIFIILFNNMILTFTSPEMKVISMFVWGYCTIKIVIAVTCNINFEYESRRR